MDSENPSSDPITIQTLNLPPSSTSATPTIKTLHETASTILTNPNSISLPSLPSTLLDLLIHVIKPLFSSSQPHHSSLNPSGRPSHFPQSTTQSTLAHFSNLSLTLDSPPWKHEPWTLPLLSAIINSYTLITPTELRRKVLEEQFFLVCPAVLNVVDDAEAELKRRGAGLIRLLCETVVGTDIGDAGDGAGGSGGRNGENIVVRSGMASVFCDALRSKFSELPSLVEEEVSLGVLREVYGAWFAVVRCFGGGSGRGGRDRKGMGDGLVKGESKRVDEEKNERKRQQCLKVVMRHGLLYGLGHLDAGRNTSYVRLTALLMGQVKIAVEMMGVDAVVFLKDVLPLCRAVLMDPFVLNAEELMLETLAVMRTTMKVCGERIRDRWWVEVLRATIGLWLNIVDEDGNVKNVNTIRNLLVEVMQDLGAIVQAQEWHATKKKLIEEEPELKQLFDGT